MHRDSSQTPNQVEVAQRGIRSRANTFVCQLEILPSAYQRTWQQILELKKTAGIREVVAVKVTTLLTGFGGSLDFTLHEAIQLGMTHHVLS